MAELSISQVSKRFYHADGAKTVLHEVSFLVPSGGLVCLLGPNGSGKTTLLKTVSTLLTPDHGGVTVDGLDLHRHQDRAKHLIGFASTEDQSFYGRLTARLNLWFYAQMYGLSEARFEARLADLVRLLDLGGGLDQPFRELSSGQKQRFLLARADLHDPAVLILDEPHQNLDPKFASHLREVIRDEWCARRKKTVLVSTHHLEDARKISDRWVVLGAGRVQFEGSVAGALGSQDLDQFFNGLTESSRAL